MSTDDAAARTECTPAGYQIYDCPRTDRGGDGIALVCRTELPVSLIFTGNRSSFESAEYSVGLEKNKIKVVIIYRTPYSRVHPITVSTFLSEFADYLESIVLTTEPLMIIGDMNIHVDDPDNSDSVEFLDLIESMSLNRHVTTPTHRSGHTLDLIITRESDSLVSTTPISGCFLSDHCTILCEPKLSRPSLTIKEIWYRKTKAIDMDTFRAELESSDLCQAPPIALSSLLDKHAPLMKKKITVRPRVPWFNSEIKVAKQQPR